MRKSDVKRLEKVVDLYRKIEDLLDKTYDSVYDDSGCDEEYVMPGMSVLNFVRDERLTALRNRQWIEAKLKTIKSNNGYTEENAG